MKLKPYRINEPERKTETLLKRFLEKYGYRVSHRTKMKEVIKTTGGDKLSEEEKRFLKEAEFDFVVYAPNNKVEFALEFDGPPHDLEEKQIRRDIKKNSLCEKASLPLIRISDIYIKEEDQATLLGFILERFIAYPKEIEELRKDIEEWYDGLSEVQKSRFKPGDNALDPGFYFNQKHPYPGLRECAKRLWGNYKIFCTGRFHFYNNPPSSIDAPYFVLDIETCSIDHDREWMRIGVKWALYKAADDHVNPFDVPFSPNADILKNDSIGFKIKAVYPTSIDYENFRDDPITYIEEYGIVPFLSSDLPGCILFSIWDNLSAYLSLKEAESQISQSGFFPPYSRDSRID